MFISVELKPFQIPNFVIQKIPLRPKETGFRELPTYALRDLDEKGLSILCDDFRAGVFAKAGKKDPRLS